MDVRRREIKEETKDRIVLTDSVLTIKCVLYALIMIVCGLFFWRWGVGFFAYPGSAGIAEGWVPRILSLFGGLILIYFAVSSILEVLDDLLVSRQISS